VIFFFWPKRASSANQIFILLGSMPFSWETLRQRICRSDGVPRRPVVAWFLNSSRQKRCRKNIRSYRQKKRYGVTAYDNRKRVFAWLYVDVLESPAWHGLSINARRVIERLLIENTRHRYRANGQLRVSYLQFAEHGVSTRFVPTAIRELKVSGLLAVAKGKRTRKYAAENLYRIKFLGTLDGPATWRHSAQKTESTPRMYGRSSKASLSKTKPWEAEGISRWTWYYLQAKSKAPIVKHKFAQKKTVPTPKRYGRSARIVRFVQRFCSQARACSGGRLSRTTAKAKLHNFARNVRYL
jgi:hypothetical protein